MKKKILITIYVILILIFLKLVYNLAINNSIISKYNKGEYDENKAKQLTYLNFPQGYVANYNYGNVLYQNREYEKAIEEYKKALNGGASKEEKCKIRINCALAICETATVNESDQDSIAKAIETYESAIDVLTEEGCANKNDNNGHSKDAEQLKKDIQKEIERLKKLQKQDNSNKKEDKKDDEKTEDKTEEIEKKIQEIKDEATKDQREVQTTYENFSKSSVNRPSKYW